MAKCATAKGEASKEEILRAAMIEFAGHGLAGARTAEIANRAGVNIALLFYYFGSKVELYRAAVEAVLIAWSGSVVRALDGKDAAAKLDTRIRVLDYAAANFDFIAEEPMRASLIQGELSRRDPQAVKLIQKLAAKHIQPVFDRLRDTIQQGVDEGIFRAVDAEQIALSINGLIRFYFTSAPVVEVLIGRDPLAPAQLKQRRIEVLEQIDAVLAPKEGRTGKRGKSA